VVSPRLTVRELIAEFLEWAEKHTRSYDYYAHFLTQFARTVPKELGAPDLRPFRVTRWLDKHPTWRANTRRCAIGAVKRVYHWGVAEGYLDFTPLAGQRKPPGERREVILSQEQRSIIFATVKDRRFRDFLLLIQETGARPQEVRAIEARHVQITERVWILPPSEHKTGRKTGRPRVIYLTPVAWKITQRLMKQHPDGPLCRNKFGRPLDQQHDSLPFSSTANAAGRENARRSVRVSLPAYVCH
jgi:integrase